MVSDVCYCILLVENYDKNSHKYSIFMLFWRRVAENSISQDEFNVDRNREYQMLSLALKLLTKQHTYWQC